MCILHATNLHTRASILKVRLSKITAYKLVEGLVETPRVQACE